jgi:hypothetical protein
MRRPSIATLPWLIVTLLPWWTAAAAHGQTDGVDGPGEAAPWSVEGSRPVPRRPATVTDDRDGFWRHRDERLPRSIKCQILEIEELDRIYVEDAAGGEPYWIQLSPEVKIRTAFPDSFGGRKKLTLEDLEVGQRLVVSVRPNDGEVVKVQVRPAKV